MDSSIDSTSTDCRPAFDIGPYAGVMLVGGFVSAALWGIATMQVILFFVRKYPGDSWRVKLLVLWVWGVDTAHKCVIMGGTYTDIVSGHAVNYRQPNEAFLATYILTSCVSVPVQSYFTWRIWRFGNTIRWILVVFLLPCILFNSAMGIFMTTRMWKLSKNNFVKVPGLNMMALSVSKLTVEAATDVVLAIGLCILLWRTYIKVVSVTAAMQSTRTTIQRLALLSINTGFWTALVGIMTMAMAIRYPGRYVHVAFSFIIAPMYDNVLLANLNARSYIREGVDGANKSGVPTASSSVRNISIRMASMTRATQQDTIAADLRKSTVEEKAAMAKEATVYENRGLIQ